MEIKIVRMKKIQDKTVKAFVDILYGDLIITGFRVVEGERGLFIGMPREKVVKDGVSKFYETVRTLTEQGKVEIEKALLAYYKEN